MAMPRLSSNDIARIHAMRNEGHTWEEITEFVGFPQSTVYHAFHHRKPEPKVHRIVAPPNCCPGVTMRRLMAGR
jgi:hypothetical protein